MATPQIMPEDILGAMGLIPQSQGVASAPAAQTAAQAPQATNAGDGVAGTLLTNNAAATSGDAANQSVDNYLNSFARDLTPQELSGWTAAGNNGYTLSAIDGGVNGVVQSGEDSGSQAHTVGSYSMASPTMNEYTGGWMNTYDPTGKFTGQHYSAPISGATKLFETGTEALLAALIGYAAMGAGGMVGGDVGAGGAATDALSVQGNSINALDAGAASNGFTVPYGSEAATGFEEGGTALTDAGGDTALTTQGNSINALEGHVNNPAFDEAINAPEPYDEATLSDEHDINVSDENPDPTSYDYRNEMDKLSDQATADNLVPPGTINSGVVPGEGPFWNTSPLQPGGTGTFDGGGGGGADGGPGSDGTPGGTGNPFDWEKLLKSFLDGLKGLIPGQDTTAGGDPNAATPPAFVPPQPSVGAGMFASAAAQGGASGSLEGIAGTLLTSKDSFGYGKSMLG